MDIFMNRTLELGQKIPHGAADFALDVGTPVFYAGNPGRPGGSFPVRLKAAVYCGVTEVLNLVAEVQPLLRAHERGYTFVHEPGVGANEVDRIVAYLPPATDAVGQLDFTSWGAYLEDRHVEVADMHQRQGVATTMYQYAETLTGKPFISRQGEALPIGAAALWANPDRPFGVDALYSQPRRLLWLNVSDLLPAPLRQMPRMVFDAQAFTHSAVGQHCIDMANGGGGPRVGLQEARLRGLMAAGHDGIIDRFIHDPNAAPRYLRGVLCQRDELTLSLTSHKGLPDLSTEVFLSELDDDCLQGLLRFIHHHQDALAEVQAMEALHPALRELDHARSPYIMEPDPRNVLHTCTIRRHQALSRISDAVDQHLSAPLSAPMPFL